MINLIQNPYFSIELKPGALENVCAGFKHALTECGVACEKAATQLHVSIAYTEGIAFLTEIEGIAKQIAHCDFCLNVRGVEVLEGKTTPFDYLVLSLDMGRAFRRAVECVEGKFSVKHFEDGMKTHISLLKIAKGCLSVEGARQLCARLSGVLKSDFLWVAGSSLTGQSVCVYNTEHERCLRIPMAGAGPELAA
jgi:hypothetical protein